MMPQCPECGSHETQPVAPLRLAEAMEPGDRVIYGCNEPNCGELFTAVIPEPITEADSRA